MWNYSEKVRDHFFNPRNSGVLEDANAIGDVGSIQCGDALRLMLKIDPETETILDARFQTFGCGSAIASSSALTEIIKGKTIQEALKLSNQDIADYLDGLPPEKMHCSVMGREALRAAIAHYRGESWKDEHEEGALVCKCFAVDAALIEDTIRANGLTTVEQVVHYTKAGGGCASCHEAIEEILAKVAKEMCTAPYAETKASPPDNGRLRPAMTQLQRMRRIQETIEAIRPQLQKDRGDIELVEIDGKNIYVDLKGACAGCMMESATLNGIQNKLVEALGEFVRLLPASRIGKVA
ncbi:MAG: Fe-S cluster assembly protein NifU [Rhodocyclaceae bacterium]|nr:Fe-S cluster assembly protein NifU [Rhodocyclaceae bacterium]